MERLALESEQQFLSDAKNKTIDPIGKLHYLTYRMLLFALVFDVLL